MTIKQSDLFTELTPEQASSVEGGAAMIINSVTAFDSQEGNGDDLYFRINGKRLRFKKNNFKRGTVAVHEGVDISRTANVQLYDEDGGIFGGSDDFIASFSVTNDGRNKVFQTTSLRRSDSNHRVEWSILAKRGIF